MGSADLRRDNGTKDNNEPLQQMLRELDLQLVEARVRTDVPKALDFSYIRDIRFAEFLRAEVVPLLTEFLSKPMIKDSFGKDHQARGRWQSQMPKKYSQIYAELDSRNKLRKGVFSALFTLRSRIKLRLRSLKASGNFGEKENQVSESIQNMPVSKDYDDLDLDRRVAYLQKLDDWIVDFLKIFEKKNETK